MQQDQNINELTSRIGGASLATIDGFLGLAFGVVALVLAVFAGAQIVAAREEEASGRVDNLLTAGAGRARWLAGRAAVMVGSVVALALVGGLSAWAGVALSGAGAGAGGMLRGALNVVPVALLFGGLTVLVFGLWPRATAGVAFGAVALAYVVQLFGSIAEAPSWLLDLSPFAHVAPVPAVAADPTSSAVMLAVGVAAAIAGAAAFTRRDTATD
jgi:ABC-2 type transport system permease protein